MWWLDATFNKNNLLFNSLSQIKSNKKIALLKTFQPFGLPLIDEM